MKLYSRYLRMLPVILLSSVLFFGSCDEDTTILYNDIAMGDIIGGKFVSDAGLTYTPVEQTCPGQLDTMGRAILQCDILKKVSATEYQVRIKQMSKVLRKDCLISDEVEDISALGNDPVLISQAWISAGYLNLSTNISFAEGSKTRHLLNLLLDKSEDNTDTLHFSLLHNSFGDCYPFNTPDAEAEEPSQTKSYSVGTAYASFPITSFVPDGKNHIPLKVKYFWYKSEGGTLMHDTYTGYVKGNIVK